MASCSGTTSSWTASGTTTWHGSPERPLPRISSTSWSELDWRATGFKPVGILKLGRASRPDQESNLDWTAGENWGPRPDWEPRPNWEFDRDWTSKLVSAVVLVEKRRRLLLRRWSWQLSRWYKQRRRSAQLGVGAIEGPAFAKNTMPKGNTQRNKSQKKNMDLTQMGFLSISIEPQLGFFKKIQQHLCVTGRRQISRTRRGNWTHKDKRNTRTHTHTRQLATITLLP